MYANIKGNEKNQNNLFNFLSDGKEIKDWAKFIIDR